MTISRLLNFPPLGFVLRRPMLFIFIVYLLVHIFIFWHALTDWPAIVAGDKFIAKDELIPIFDWQSQFINQIVGGGKSLTYSNEVRLSYTFWTAWMRYSSILPIALVLLNTLSATLMTYSVFIVIRSLVKPSSLRNIYLVLYAAVLGSFPIYLILLYAKLTTFYSLIIGFAMFALAISYVLIHAVTERRPTVKGALLVSLLVLLNPAIHFHVLFYIVFVMVLAGVVINDLVRKRYELLKPLVKYAALVFAISGVPYAILILLSLKAAGAGDVTDQIPLSYWGVFYNSIPLEHQFGFSTTAQIDVGKYGSYLATTPRLTTLILFGFMVVGLTLLKGTKSLTRLTKFYIACFGFMLLAMFMAIGYGDNKASYSFHVLLGQVTGLMDYLGKVGELINKAIYVFMNILRYPHRFQFIQYYFAAITLGLSFIVISITYRKWLRYVLPTMGALVIGALFFNHDYRSTFLDTNGEMGGFTRAYAPPEDLKRIKTYLGSQQDPKLFILPSLESSRVLKERGKTYSFIDKGWIYYLNVPTYYYGAGAGMDNKAMAAEVYASIRLQSNIWERITANSIGATHILIPKHTMPNSLQVQYHQLLERHVRDATGRLTYYRSVLDGDYYQLLERITPASKDTCFVETRTAIGGCPKDARIVFPVQYRQTLAEARTGALSLHSDDAKRAGLTIESAANQDKVFFPSSNRLPYQEKMVEGSVFATTGPSLQVLNIEKSRYNLFNRKLPGLATLSAPKFVGTIQKGLSLDYNVSRVTAGRQDIYIFALSQQDALRLRVGGQEYKATPISAKTTSGYYRYFHVSIPDASAQYKVTVYQDADEPLIVSHLYVRDAQARQPQLAPVRRDQYSIGL